MNKARVLSTMLLLAVFGAFGAVYQFYFKEKLESYSEDQKLRDNLESAYTDLKSTFQGYQPDVLTKAWGDQQLPWQQAVESRTGYFNDGGWYVAEKPPEDVPILRFWYGETANKMILDIYQKMVEARLSYFPVDLYSQFNVVRAEEWQGLNVKRWEAVKNLANLAFGISALQMLLDAKATRIDTVVLWPLQDKAKHNNLLKSRTIGMRFAITMENLVKLLEKLRQADQYWSVDALKIEYPYLAYPAEPQLTVQMLLTQLAAKPKPQAAAGAVAPGALGAPAATPGLLPSPALSTPQALFSMQDRPMGLPVKTAEPGFLAKAWKWFKRTYFYTN